MKTLANSRRSVAADNASSIGVPFFALVAGIVFALSATSVDAGPIRIAAGAPDSDELVVVKKRAVLGDLQLPIKKIQEGGNGEEPFAEVEFETGATAPLDAYFNANRQGNTNSSIPFNIYMTEPAPTPAGDTDAGTTKIVISDKVTVTLFLQDNRHEYNVVVRLYSDPQDDFPKNTAPGGLSVKVTPEVNGPMDLVALLPAGLAGIFAHLNVISDTVQVTSSGKSVNFNAATSTLSFANDFLGPVNNYANQI